MTLLHITRLIEGIASRQPSVNMVVRDSVLKLNDTPANKYGAFVWTQGQHGESIDTDMRTFRFTFFYVDRLTFDKGNQTEVQSVGIDTLGNIIRALAEECDITSWTIDTFTQRFKDECAGAYATLEMRVPIGTACAEDYEPVDIYTI